MDKQERLDDIKKKISEYEEKLNDLKNSIAEEINDSKKKEAEQTLNEIREIKEKMQLQYSELKKVDITDEPKLKEIEKNIYSSFETFDKAFKRAGGIFKKRP